MERLIRPLLALLLLLASVPSLVHADANSEARVFFERGNEHLQRATSLRGSRRNRELQQALAEYVSSLRIVRTKNAVFNAGVSLEMLGRLDEAFDYFAEYVTMPGITPEENAEGVRRRDALRPRVAVLRITSEPAGAEVRIDRPDLAPRGVTPLEIAVATGARRVFFTRAGYAPAETEASATVGQAAAVAVRLDPLPVRIRIAAPSGGTLTLDGREVAAGTDLEVLPGAHVVNYQRPNAPPVERRFEVEPGSEPRTIELSDPAMASRGNGQIVVDSRVAARVLVDGQLVGTGRHVAGWVVEGTHTVRVEADGHVPYTGRTEVEADQTTTANVALAPSVEGETTLGALPTIAAAGTVIIGSVAVAASVRAIILEGNHAEDLDQYRMTPTQERFDSLESLASDVDDANLLADVLWIGTGVLGIAWLILGIADRPVEQTQSSATFSVAAGPGGGGVFASIAWGAP